MFGNIDISKEALSTIVEDLDKESETRELLPDEFSTRQHAMMRIWGLNRMEEISWKQKSRVGWLKECDKNSRFFHQMATVRRGEFFGKD